MSYIPSTTLRSVWPTLNDQNKLSIQLQLDQLFERYEKYNNNQEGDWGVLGGRE